MDTFNPIILGIVTKLYDDFTDMKMEKSPFIIESLKSLIILFMTLTCLNDFYLSFVILIGALFDSGVDNPFWKTIIIIAIIMLIINLPKAGENIMKKLGIFSLMLIGILMAGYIEAKSFPEEVSIKKIIFRIILIIACGIFVFYPIINIPDYINGPLRKMILTLFSYLIISVGTQVWLLIKN
jgi:hypothetical protein